MIIIQIIQFRKHGFAVGWGGGVRLPRKNAWAQRWPLAAPARNTGAPAAVPSVLPAPRGNREWVNHTSLGAKNEPESHLETSLFALFFCIFLKSKLIHSVGDCFSLKIAQHPKMFHSLLHLYFWKVFWFGVFRILGAFKIRC